MKRLVAPIVLAFASMALAAVFGLALPGVERHVLQQARDGRALPKGLRLIDNPFDATLLAQPNRGPINIVAPYRVTVGATAVQLTTSGNVNGGVCVKALVPGQTMYLGLAGVTTATGWPMTDNESLCLEVRNANVVYAIASAAAQSVAVLPFSRF